jgi:hypothetical protein
MRDDASSGVSVIDGLPSITLEFSDTVALKAVAQVSRLLMCAISYAEVYNSSSSAVRQW